MPPFDLEQGKLSVRVSEGVYHQLLADVDDFNFRKHDGSDNISGFSINCSQTLLPIE